MVGAGSSVSGQRREQAAARAGNGASGQRRGRRLGGGAAHVNGLRPLVELGRPLLVWLLASQRVEVRERQEVRLFEADDDGRVREPADGVDLLLEVAQLRRGRTPRPAERRHRRRDHVRVLELRRDVQDLQLLLREQDGAVELLELDLADARHEDRRPAGRRRGGRRRGGRRRSGGGRRRGGRLLLHQLAEERVGRALLLEVRLEQLAIREALVALLVALPIRDASGRLVGSVGGGVAAARARVGAAGRRGLLLLVSRLLPGFLLVVLELLLVLVLLIVLLVLLVLLILIVAGAVIVVVVIVVAAAAVLQLRCRSRGRLALLGLRGLCGRLLLGLRDCRRRVVLVIVVVVAAAAAALALRVRDCLGRGILRLRGRLALRVLLRGLRGLLGLRRLGLRDGRRRVALGGPLPLLQCRWVRLDGRLLHRLASRRTTGHLFQIAEDDRGSTTESGAGES
jgi:hypothetical protein